MAEAKPKPGVKTSEFWLAAVATIFAFVMASGMVPEAGVWGQVTGVVGGILASMGYSVSRGIAKKNA